MAKAIKIEGLTYEQALAELEKIVQELEGEMHSLDESLKLFERGQALAKYCAELLDKAELKVKELSNEGEMRESD
ncbi:MAG: exodeoxyribonuclease VII small subunit [Anaerolineales bacterium]